jgi:predicted RNase H-like HicB family nuclease
MEWTPRPSAINLRRARRGLEEAKEEAAVMSKMNKTGQANQAASGANAAEMLHYTLKIKWSDQDARYVVILPEWAERYMMPLASGKTYEEAAARGHNALENYVRFAREDGLALPEPRIFVADEA